MTETNLLPCPFCGGEATPKLAPYIGGGGCGYIVDCDKCWSQTGYYSQKAKAIEAWNTRAERTCELEETESYSSLELVHVLECSECGETCEHTNGSYPRCPHCGRKVVER